MLLSGAKQSFGPKGDGALPLGNRINHQLDRHVCEGWATGVHLWRALGNVIVWIAFGAGRMRALAEWIRSTNPAAPSTSPRRRPPMPLEYVQPHGAWGNDAADWPGTPEELRAKLEPRMQQARAAQGTPRSNPTSPPAADTADPFDWVEDYELTDAEVEAIADPVWAYPNLLIQGHILVLCAAPNGGKTTIMLRVSAQMAAQGYDVLYINADVSGADAKAMHHYSRESGFRMLFPDMKTGKSVDDIMVRLREMADRGADLSGYVVIIDTLKKVTNLMDKKRQSTLYKLLRKLTAKGLTICLNSHTNKYNSADGMPVYEGTNEVRTESDDLVYLASEKDDATGEMLVSTVPDKQRGTFQPITFRIDAARNVSRADHYVDTVTRAKQRRQYEDDRDLIARIEHVLSGGPKNQTEIVDQLRDDGIARKTARRVLQAYGSRDTYRQHWWTEKAIGRHLLRYGLVADTAHETTIPPRGQGTIGTIGTTRTKGTIQQ